MFLKDDGGGITERSLAFWNQNKGKIGLPISVEASFEGLVTEDRTENGITYPVEYNLIIHGYAGDILLSGCNCGYGGTGPNGTAKILAELGIPIETARQAMVHKRLTYDILASKLVLDGEVYDFPLAQQRRAEWAKFISEQES